MAANFKKVLFEGSNIDVRAITASNLQELTADTPGVTDLPILSYDEDTGIFRQIVQDDLNQAVGTTLFTVSGSDNTSDSFNAASDTLSFIAPPGIEGQLYFNIVATNSPSNATTVNFAVDNFVTGSGQMNLISGSSLLAGSTTTTPAADADFLLGVQNLGTLNGAGFAPTLALNSLAGDWYTAFRPFLLRHLTNSSSIVTNKLKVDPDLPLQLNTPQTGDDTNLTITNWRSTTNLYKNRFSGTSEGDGLISPTPAGAIGKYSYLWLSSSFVGGFNDGTTSISASYSEFTSSVFSISSSASNLGISASTLNEINGSSPSGSFLISNTSVIALSESLDSKTINSIEAGNVFVDQITFFGEDESGTTLDQGARIALGTPTNDADIQAIDATARDLTILNTFTADSFELGSGLAFNQVNVSRINGGINFGTSSLHTHQFQGNTFLTGALAVTGTLHIGGDETGPPNDPPSQNSITPWPDTPTQVLVADDNGKLGFVNFSGSAFAAVITGSATAVSNSFNTDIGTVQGIVGTAGTDATAIDTLQEGFTTNADSLQNLYETGILFGTGSDVILGEKVTPSQTASFSGTETTGTNILSASFVSGKVRYTIHPDAFANAVLQDASGNIYTSSVAISASVASLNRYVEDTAGVLTGSAASDILDISNLATDLPNGTGQHFITGAGDFSDLTNFTGVNQFSSPSQGVAEFSLEGTYKFGATGSAMGPGNNPQFTDLIIDNGSGGGDLRVLGTLIEVNSTNLLVKDQFVLINSGALKASGENTSDNDKDGGVIVGAGDTSGSMLMYDFTQRSWGFLGSQDADNVGNEVESSEQNTLSPEALIRVIRHAEGTPPSDINDILYGVSTAQSQKGIMYIDTSDNAVAGENLYIYA